MRIAITGAAGFIGRSLTLRLAAAGHEVLALDSNVRGNLDLLPDRPGLTKRQIDVVDASALAGLFEGVDAVYHLAAINGTRNFYEIPARVLEIGVIGTHNVLKAVLECGVGSFYYASSSEVYGTPAVIPTPESVECRIADVFNPRYSYAGGKLAGELLTINYLRGTGTRYVIFRPHNVYGPQMGHDHVIPQLVRKIVEARRVQPGPTVTIPLQGSGEETRAFIYIDDATRAIELATLGAAEDGLIHIGTQDEIRIRELAEAVGRALGVEVKTESVPVMQGSPSRRCPDTSRLRALGFAPEFTLQQGLERTVRWYADHYERGAAEPVHSQPRGSAV